MANIVDFPAAEPLPINTMTIAPRPFGFCTHDSIILDVHSRQVQCADPKCGRVLDAFNYLHTNAESIGRAWSSYRHVKEKAAEVEGRVNLLLREEQRLRAMVKRLQDKSGAVVTVKTPPQKIDIE